MVRHEGTKHRVEWPDKKNEGVIALCNYFPNLYKRFIKTSGGTILTPTRSPGLPCRYLSDCVPKTEVIHSSLNSTIARTSIMMIWKNTIKDLKLSTRIGARHCCINMQELLILYWMALNMKCVLGRLQISLRKYQNTAAIMQLQILKHNIFVRKWF